MSGINGIGNSSAVQRVVNQPVIRQAPPESEVGLRGSDRLELSGMSHLLASLRSSGIRSEKVAAIKAQIDAGTYENDAKLNAAIDRMIDDVL